MLPEGGHNRSADLTYFVLNRKKIKDLQLEQQKMLQDPNSILVRSLKQERLEALRSLSEKKIDIKLYNIKKMEWILDSRQTEKNQLYLTISLKGQTDFSVQVFEHTSKKQELEIKAHAFLNYTWLGNMKFSIQTLKGSIFGIEILKPEQITREELDKAFQFSPYKMIEEDLNQNGQTLFLLSIMKNRLDDKAKRGAIVKALALGSKLKIVEQFKGILNKSIDAIFQLDDPNKPKEENFMRIKDFIGRLYENLNKRELKDMIPYSDFLQKRVFRDINKNFASTSSDQTLYRHYDLNFNNQINQIVIPQTLFPDELATTSIKKFMMKFGERCMLIYDAIISEKKILFSGGLDFSADEIQEYVFACAAIVSPPLIGILTKLYPYAALSNLDFLEEPGYIAGVTNPMFKQRVNWYDLCCEIDIGKLKVSRNDDFYEYSDQKYYQLDMDFIRPIVQRVRQNSINDEEIKRAFESYTLLMIDGSLKDNSFRNKEIVHDNDKIFEMLQPRIQRFQRTNLFKTQQFLFKIRELDMKENIPLSLVDKLLRRLRVSREISDHETLTIFQQIDQYVQDYDSVLKLLYLMPKSRDGLIRIAQGLFSVSEQVQTLATNILRKIELTDVGKHHISTLNYFIMLKYQANLNQEKVKA